MCGDRRNPNPKSGGPPIGDRNGGRKLFRAARMRSASTWLSDWPDDDASDEQRSASCSSEVSDLAGSVAAPALRLSGVDSSVITKSTGTTMRHVWRRGQHNASTDTHAQLPKLTPTTCIYSDYRSPADWLKGAKGRRVRAAADRPARRCWRGAGRREEERARIREAFGSQLLPSTCGSSAKPMRVDPATTFCQLLRWSTGLFV